MAGQRTSYCNSIKHYKIKLEQFKLENFSKKKCCVVSLSDHTSFFYLLLMLIIPKAKPIYLTFSGNNESVCFKPEKH